MRYRALVGSRQSFGNRPYRGIANAEVFAVRFRPRPTVGGGRRV